MKKNILFLGTHGQKNWGDELLLESFLYNLKEVGNLTVNSYDPEETTKLFGVKAFHTTKNPLNIIWQIFKSDLVFFGGGNIVKELYVEYGGQRYSTLQKLKILTFVSKYIFGKKVIFSNIGIGPIETEKGLQYALDILQVGDLISFRDTESVKYAQKIKLKREFDSLPDVVFSLDRQYFDLPLVNDASSKIENIKDLKKVGVNLCRNIAKSENWDYFIESLSADILKLHELNKEIEFIGIPMQRDAATNDDYQALNEFFTNLTKSAPNLKYDIIKPNSVKDIVLVLNGLDLVIAERLHILILSTVLSIPYVGLEYDIKVTALLKDLGLSEYGVAICEKFESGSILERVENITKDYQNHKTKLSKVYNIKHNLMVDFFAKVKSFINKN